MAIQTVNTGTTPNDGTGDPARTAFIKVNDNFTQPENAASRLVATNAQALAGTAGVLPDAEGVHAAIRGLAVGTVSQSGGVPTGAIIERGSNVNGEYVRFADGTQICQITKTDVSVKIDAALHGGFRSAGLTWTYPIDFVDNPDVAAKPLGLSAFGAQVANTYTSSCSYVYTSVTSQSAASRDISIVAIGRWY